MYEIDSFRRFHTPNYIYFYFVKSRVSADFHEIALILPDSARFQVKRYEIKVFSADSAKISQNFDGDGEILCDSERV